MGQVRCIRGVYYIEFYARGLLYSQVAGTDIKEAKRLLAAVEDKIADGEALTLARHIDLQDFYQRFISHLQKEYPVATLRRYSALIEHFAYFIQTHYPQSSQLDHVTPALIESYQAYLIKTQTVKTVNFSILLLRDVLEFGITLGFIHDNPSTHARLLPWPFAPQRGLTPRCVLAQSLLSQGVGLAKLSGLLKLSDVAKALYFACWIPLKRV